MPPLDAWQQALHGMPGFSDSLIEHLGAVARDHQVGVLDAEDTIVEELTGRQAESLETFIERNRDYFRGTERKGVAYSPPALLMD